MLLRDYADGQQFHPEVYSELQLKEYIASFLNTIPLKEIFLGNTGFESSLVLYLEYQPFHIADVASVDHFWIQFVWYEPHGIFAQIGKVLYP